MNRATAIRRRIRIGRAAAVALLVVFCQIGARLQAQYLPDDRNSCRSCHIDAQKKTDFCQLFEASIYERDDKHSKAFFLLHERDPRDPSKGQAKRELVKQILGFELRDAFTDDAYSRLKEPIDAEASRKVQAVTSCLRCHATWPVAANSPTQPPVQPSLGVSCQACHGPGQKWFLVHQLAPYAWRAVAPEAKASLGFYDVRSTAKKAELCASCHVGNIREEKFVRHEWYAGGHPPLPSFELANFESQMPVHWQALSEKSSFAFREGTLNREDAAVAGNLRSLADAGVPPAAIKDNYLEAHGLTAANVAGELWRTKDVAVGGAAVLGMYVRMIGDYAELAADNKAAWPELALYDCSACHHELRTGLAAGTRPKRSHIPGRPPLAMWPGQLSMLAGQLPTDADNKSVWPLLQSQLTQLDRALTNRPFGSPDEVRLAGQPAAEALRQLADQASHAECKGDAARQALAVLTDPSQLHANDFYSARQTAWAIRQIAKDLKSPEADRLFLSGNDDPLCLELPSGPERSVMENLKRWLPAVSKYDPAWFEKELQSVRQAMSR
jgi:mono/diheme cytochrome c family protein/cytochrome c553